MKKKLPNTLKLELKKLFETRYGENPHLRGAFYLNLKEKDPLSLQNFQKLQGKEISFNNLLDASSAILTISELGRKQPAGVIIKHGNPCGAALGKDARDAFYRAWEKGDSLAAFGGVIALNREVTKSLAKVLAKKFFEVLLVPKIEKPALAILIQKPKLIILVNPALKNPKPAKELDIKKIRGGFLVQEPDLKEITEKDLKVVTKIKPADKQAKDLLFAWKICKVSKSNAIILVKDKTLIASGVGQQDRKRCCEIAVRKAGKRAKNTVAASDGFFPFPDGPKVLIKAGVKAIAQPGGSIRDKDVIAVCNQYKIPMVFTNIRCFKH